MNRVTYCSTCKSVSKSLCYMCETGHHDGCENYVTGTCWNRNDDSDCKPEKEYSPTSRKKSTYHSALNHHDMCSGDHSTNVNVAGCQNILNHNNDVPKSILDSISIHKSGCTKCKPTMMVIYRNEKFHGHESSVTSNYIDSTKGPINEMARENVPRPVACPVVSCSKIVTIDSFSQHFNFDHPKVPRMLLNRRATQDILFNCLAISKETQCIATFVISQEKRYQPALRRITSRTNIHDVNKDCSILLLMSAKITTVPLNISNKKHAAEDSISKTNIVEDLRKRSNQINKIPSKSFSNDYNEVLLLWLCTLQNESGIYSISISREDNRQGYSYIGPAIHIRNEQDPSSIYAQTDCLSVRRTAVNKLLTDDNELKVTISTVQ